MTAPMTASDYHRYLFPNYRPAPFVPVRGEGSRVWDQDGKEYIDLLAGIAVSALGHCHPALVEALTSQAKKLWHLSNYQMTEPGLALAKRLTDLTFAERVLFHVSGTEAVEAAVKLARRHAWVKGDTERTKIVSLRNSFHGRSMLAIALNGRPAYVDGYGPLPSPIAQIDLNDEDAARREIDSSVACVIVEPVQGESGIRPATASFLRTLRDCCKAEGALLIYDEVQTGVGRTGSLYAYQLLGVEPDILCSAKALGAGVPISAVLTRAEIADSMPPGTHGSTFGGNPMACAVALKALDIIAEPSFLAGVARKGELMQSMLAEMSKSQLIGDVRGCGMLIGCDLVGPVSGKARPVVEAANKRGVLLSACGTSTLRLTPPLNTDDETLVEALGHIQLAIQDVAEAH